MDHLLSALPSTSRALTIESLRPGQVLRLAQTLQVFWPFVKRLPRAEKIPEILVWARLENRYFCATLA